MLTANGSALGTWPMSTFADDFGPAADFDDSGCAQLLVTSDDGIGILKFERGTFTAIVNEPNGTRFGGWLYSTPENRVGSTGRYAGGTRADCFITSGWGVGILRLEGGVLTAPMMKPNGTRFGGWLLNTADNTF